MGFIRTPTERETAGVFLLVVWLSIERSLRAYVQAALKASDRMRTLGAASDHRATHIPSIAHVKFVDNPFVPSRRVPLAGYCPAFRRGHVAQRLASSAQHSHRRSGVPHRCEIRAFSLEDSDRQTTHALRKGLPSYYPSTSQLLEQVASLPRFALYQFRPVLFRSSLQILSISSAVPCSSPAKTMSGEYEKIPPADLDTANDRNPHTRCVLDVACRINQCSRLTVKLSCTDAETDPFDDPYTPILRQALPA